MLSEQKNRKISRRYGRIEVNMKDEIKEKKKRRMPEIGESVFDIGYLLFDLIAAVLFFTKADGRQLFYLYGTLTLLLGGGDAFHLIPRVDRALRGSTPSTEKRLGFGLAVSSVTMTVFYILLMYIWMATFPGLTVPPILFVLVWGTALLRIILCLFPQNNWLHREGNPRWSFYRNAPFAVTGICLIILYLISGNTGNYGLWKMAPAIIGSFACYLPVTVWAKKKPMIGMLMIPKTCMYIWMITMGLGLLGKI
jgi:hypothetical protein